MESYGYIWIIAEGKIPNIKKEGKIYFERAALIEWLQSGKRKTKTEIAAEANIHLTSRVKKPKLRL